MVGESLFYGARRRPDLTSSSSSLISPRRRSRWKAPRAWSALARPRSLRKCLPAGESVSKYYLRLHPPRIVLACLAQIAGALGESGIGILSVIQPEGQEEGAVPPVLMVHDAAFESMSKALEKIASLSVASRPVLAFSFTSKLFPMSGSTS